MVTFGTLGGPTAPPNRPSRRHFRIKYRILCYPEIRGNAPGADLAPQSRKIWHPNVPEGPQTPSKSRPNRQSAKTPTDFGPILQMLHEIWRILG